MDRIIKFRFWDFRLQSYSYFDLANALPMYQDVKEGIIEQFTGMLDKNGIEIHKGDLLRYNHEGEPDLFGKCVFDTYQIAFVFKIISFDRHNGDTYSMFQSMSPNLTVVGNINENPELVKN